LSAVFAALRAFLAVFFELALFFPEELETRLAALPARRSGVAPTAGRTAAAPSATISAGTA
jgi:hypothetical protein